MIVDKIRDINEFQELYNSIDNKELHSLEEILKAGKYVFCFYSENKLFGVIYLSNKGGKVFLNGFSKRKNFLNNIQAIRTVCDYFPIDIYSNTPLKHAALSLKRAGFKKIDNNLYLRRHIDG